MVTKQIKVIIAGGRDFNDYDLLERSVDRMLSKLFDTHAITIVSGGARGADALAIQYANNRSDDVELLVMRADWDTHGKSAGYKRNAEMAEVSTHLIAFHDGQSRGTQHMIDLAIKMNLKTCIITY